MHGPAAKLVLVFRPQLGIVVPFVAETIRRAGSKHLVCAAKASLRHRLTALMARGRAMMPSPTGTHRKVPRVTITAATAASIGTSERLRRLISTASVPPPPPGSIEAPPTRARRGGLEGAWRKDR